MREARVSRTCYDALVTGLVSQTPSHSTMQVFVVSGGLVNGYA